MGNHDSSIPNDTTANWWFNQWIDPMGINTNFSGVKNSERPYKTNGEYDFESQSGTISGEVIVKSNDCVISYLASSGSSDSISIPNL